MKGMLIYLPFDTAIRQWLTHHYGNPVVFPAQSVENVLLIRLISKRPSGVPVLDRTDDPKYVPITVPDNAIKPSEHYNYLGHRGRMVLSAAIFNLFKLSLWSECFTLINSGELNAGIDRWCMRNGIELDAREAVRQKFYRMRKNYLKNGIIIGNYYKKRIHEGVSKRTD